jgi:hypothetical protein
MSITSIPNEKSQTLWASQLNKCFYQEAQQAKLMDLQAEVDNLLQQLQNLKMQKHQDI